MSEDMTYAKFMKILQILRKDMPEWRELRYRAFCTPEDHRLLAAYYTLALGLTPAEALVGVYRVIEFNSRTVSLFTRYHDNHCRKQCIVCWDVVPDKRKYARAARGDEYEEIRDHVEYEENLVFDYAEMLQGYKPSLAMLRSCLATL